jgi:hypothetical protein
MKMLRARRIVSAKVRCGMIASGGQTLGCDHHVSVKIGPRSLCMVHRNQRALTAVLALAAASAALL